MVATLVESILEAQQNTIAQVKVALTSNYMRDMTEATIDSDERSKRRLPIWMQSNNTFKNENLGNLDELCSILGNQTEGQGAVSMVESMSSEAGVVLSEPKRNSGNKEILANNYSKKNSRKPKKRDASKDSKCNRKLKSVKRNSVNVLPHGVTEDAAELIVEDLISIAEELLNSDKEMQNEQSVAQQSESDSVAWNSSEPFIPHRGEMISCQVLSSCTQTRSSHLNNIEPKQTEESATSSANKVTQSRDASQDMLELLLGPLLKRGPLKEPDPYITRELLPTTYESDGLVKSFVDAENKAPLMKKKSSLKDKVAMFF